MTARSLRHKNAVDYSSDLYIRKRASIEDDSTIKDVPEHDEAEHQIEILQPKSAGKTEGLLSKAMKRKRSPRTDATRKAPRVSRGVLCINYFASLYVLGRAVKEQHTFTLVITGPVQACVVCTKLARKLKAGIISICTVVCYVTLGYRS